jgi:hypothetical protein
MARYFEKSRSRCGRLRVKPKPGQAAVRQKDSEGGREASGQVLSGEEARA